MASIFGRENPQQQAEREFREKKLEQLEKDDKEKIEDQRQRKKSKKNSKIVGVILTTGGIIIGAITLLLGLPNMASFMLATMEAIGLLFIGIGFSN